MSLLTNKNLTDLLRDELDDTLPNFSSATLTRWNNALNDFTYREIQNVDPQKYVETQLIKVIDGTDTYALPSDFTNIFFRENGIYKTNPNTGNIDNERLVETHIGSEKEGFILDGNNIIFTPLPSGTGTWLAYDAQSGDFTVGLTVTGGTSGATGVIEVDQDDGTSGFLKLSSITEGTTAFVDGEALTDTSTGSATTDGILMTPFRLRYIPGLTKLSADGDESVIEDIFEEYALYWLLKKYYGNPQIKNHKEEVNSDQRFARELSLLLNNFKRTQKVIRLTGNLSNF